MHHFIIVGQPSKDLQEGSPKDSGNIYGLYWDNVVGILVAGATWQFKDWPQRDDLSSLLVGARAFHIRGEDDPETLNQIRSKHLMLKKNRNIPI